ncbi:MAG: hypothetical protein R3Y23_04455 [Bacillota bacterium]
MENVEDILFQIEQLLIEGKKQIFGSGVTVDGDEMASAIARLRESMPSIIADAQTMIAEEDYRTRKTEQEMCRLVQSAQKQAQELVASHTITLNAQREADIIMAKADEYAKRVYESVKNDCNQVLSYVENTLQQAKDIVTSAKANSNQ